MTRDELDAEIDGALKSFSSHSDREVTLARLLRGALAVVDGTRGSVHPIVGVRRTCPYCDNLLAFDAALASEHPESPPRAGGESR